MSLRIRLLVTVAITFAVVVVGCVYAAHVSTSHELHSQVDSFLIQRSHDGRIQAGVRAPRGGPESDDEIPPFAEPDALVQILRNDGSVFVSAGLPIDAYDRAIAGGDGKPRFRDVTTNDTHYRVLTVPVYGGAAQIARSISDTDDVLSTLDVRLLLIALAGTVLAALLAWVIARRIVRPVERLTSATEQVAVTQDLNATIAIDRRDELGRLASSFNTMLRALRTSREQQKRLVMDASHELRTPLTALRTNIDVMRRAELDDAQQAELLGQIDVELGELTALFTELVELATDARTDEPTQRIELETLVRDVVERFRRRTNRNITFNADHAAAVDGRASAIERAVANLIDNACKFSTDAVDVVVHGASVEVRDRGIGIDASDREHVFDRFYRAPAARTMPGSGLGLSIVEQIAALHDGRIELLPRDGGGTVARLSLPPAPSGST